MCITYSAYIHDSSINTYGFVFFNLYILLMIMYTVIIKYIYDNNVNLSFFIYMLT